MASDSVPASRASRPSARRRHAREEAPDAAHAGISRPIVCSLPRLNFLTEAQVEQIHEASLKVLAQTGILFKSDDALAHFRRAGARVEEGRVYLTRDLIETCLKTAPAEFTLHARNPANDLTIGGRTTAAAPSGGAPYVRGLDGVRRTGTLEDVQNFARLTALSPDVHLVARKAAEAQDIPGPIRHLDCWKAVLTLTEKPGISGTVFGRPEAEDTLQMLSIVFGGDEAIDGHPVGLCNVNSNSPLVFDKPMAEGLMAFAARGQPVVVTPFVMAGVMGPTTLAGSLALHNAEVLAGVSLSQIVRPGAPVLYGTATSNVDMRSASPAIGSPESALSVGVAAQMARRYGLPCRGGGALTDSHLPDAQANYERMQMLFVSVLAGVNVMLHGLGTLDSYLTIDYEQFVIDTEIIAMLRHLVRPLEITPETLALDTIASVGPGGFYLDAPHTMRHYRQAHFMPRLSLRQFHDQWAAEGSSDTPQRANRLCREMLAVYVKPPMDAAVEARLDDFVERRRAELTRQEGH
jgi:glycine betaine---corrinoid protein Co-methyltransferase